MTTKFCLVGGLLAATLVGCTHPRVTSYLPSDPRLTCQQINQEIAKAEEAITTIDKKTGVSWRNAGLLLFSGVGLVMNEVNGSRERTAAQARIEHLRELARQNNCS